MEKGLWKDRVSLEYMPEDQFITMLAFMIR